VVLPGLVARTHLNACASGASCRHLRRLDSRRDGRASRPDPSASEILDGVRAGIDRLWPGTAVVGDISIRW
jgi:hypothetical protein